MALERRYRPLTTCLKCANYPKPPLATRPFATSTSLQQEAVETATYTPSPNQVNASINLANVVSTPRSERKLFATHGVYPVGSRRRRAAIARSPNIPFHQLPYQCFQEARKYLQEDRKEKVEDIEQQSRRIANLRASLAQAEKDGCSETVRKEREHRLRSMNKHLAELKILADINDPIVKKKFEDGMGDMNKPIYRHLADLQWRSYKRKVLMQRITQMNVIPDILPHADPIVSTALSFGRKRVPHGDIVLSAVSEQAPTINIQPYDKGKRWVTIAVVNPDVPDVSKDAFNYRCHFLASNIKISPTKTRVELGSLDPETQVILNWLPAFAQKGLPYQRLGIFVLEQEAYQQDSEAQEQSKELEDKLEKIYNPARIIEPTPAEAVSVHEYSNDTATSTTSSIIPLPQIRQQARYTKREHFILRSFCSKYNLKPVGVDLFRTQWDEGTAEVMQRAGVLGWDVEFKRKRVEPLPYQRLKSERYR